MTTENIIYFGVLLLQFAAAFELYLRLEKSEKDKTKHKGDVQAFAEWIYHIHQMNRGWWVQARDPKTGRFYQHPIPSWMRPIARQSAARIKKETGRE